MSNINNNNNNKQQAHNISSGGSGSSNNNSNKKQLDQVQKIYRWELFNHNFFQTEYNFA